MWSLKRETIWYCSGRRRQRDMGRRCIVVATLIYHWQHLNIEVTEASVSHVGQRPGSNRGVSVGTMVIVRQASIIDSVLLLLLLRLLSWQRTFSSQQAESSRHWRRHRDLSWGLLLLVGLILEIVSKCLIKRYLFVLNRVKMAPVSRVFYWRKFENMNLVFTSVLLTEFIETN